MVNFGLLTTEIDPVVWGTPANFNGFRVLAACSVTARHLVVGVSQTLRRWTEGATYVRHGDHHVGHWPTFLVISELNPWLMFSATTGISMMTCRSEQLSWSRRRTASDSRAVQRWVELLYFSWQQSSFDWSRASFSVVWLSSARTVATWWVDCDNCRSRDCISSACWPNWTSHFHTHLRN